MHFVENFLNIIPVK